MTATNLIAFFKVLPQEEQYKFMVEAEKVLPQNKHKKIPKKKKVVLTQNEAARYLIANVFNK